MNIITLAEIKKHIRIDPDITLEDDMLELYGNAAEETVLDMVDKTLEEIVAEYGSVPIRLKQACLVLTASSGEIREPASAQQMYNVPYKVDALLKPLMRM